MFVCMCSAITDEMIIDEIKKGSDTVEKISEVLGVSNICGSCEDEVTNIIASTKLKFVKVEK